MFCPYCTALAVGVFVASVKSGRDQIGAGTPRAVMTLQQEQAVCY